MKKRRNYEMDERREGSNEGSNKGRKQGRHAYTHKCFRLLRPHALKYGRAYQPPFVTAEKSLNMALCNFPKCSGSFTLNRLQPYTIVNILVIFLIECLAHHYSNLNVLKCQGCTPAPPRPAPRTTSTRMPMKKMKHIRRKNTSRIDFEPTISVRDTSFRPGRNSSTCGEEETGK